MGRALIIIMVMIFMVYWLSQDEAEAYPMENMRCLIQADARTKIETECIVLGKGEIR